MKGIRNRFERSKLYAEKSRRGLGGAAFVVSGSFNYSLFRERARIRRGESAIDTDYGNLVANKTKMLL